MRHDDSEHDTEIQTLIAEIRSDLEACLHDPELDERVRTQLSAIADKMDALNDYTRA